MARNWSVVEVEALVEDHLTMLAKEIRAEPYSKSAHRRAIAERLDNRSSGSIERKHQNVSAVLIALGCPYISGYKPLGNYQRLLSDIVSSRVTADGFRSLVRAAVESEAQVPTVEDILARLMVRPAPVPAGDDRVKTPSSGRIVAAGSVNYLEREARNASLGLAGEKFALNFERARLLSVGRDRLASSVEHVSVTQGDGAGFDIRSFESDGSERLIEVKTTAYGSHTPIFLSPNELRVSRERRDRYHLYRPYQFRADPRLFVLTGALDQTCRLEPSQYRGHVA